MNSGISKMADIDPQDQHQPNSRPYLDNASFFNTIPPERMGLNGEYDYHGLVKRVYRAFYEQMTAEELRSLKVKQRGSVIILAGKVTTYAQLTRLIQIALSVEGTVEVEANGVMVQDSRELGCSGSGFLGSHRYAYG